MTHKLIKCYEITGELEAVTGLHIGGSSAAMEISGLDNPIVRNPATFEPYIPGSSLKGKMRSLIEWALGELPTDGDVTKPIIHGAVAAVFGKPATKPKDKSNTDESPLQSGPTRLVVRDCYLTKEWSGFFQSKALTEIKTENSINRLTGVANPRPMERVIPGVRFSVEIIYKIFDTGDNGNKDEENFDKVLLPAIALLEADALGGGGSRGNGKIKFHDLKKNGSALTLPSLVDVLKEQK